MTLLATQEDPSLNDVESLLKTARKRRISASEVVDLGFKEGLRLARACIAQWQERARKEDISGEIDKMRKTLMEKRRRLFAADVRNSQAIFESYQLATDTAKLLTAYNGLRETLHSWTAIARKRGIKVEPFPDPIDVVTLRKLSARYLFRQKKGGSEEKSSERTAV